MFRLEPDTSPQQSDSYHLHLCYKFERLYHDEVWSQQQTDTLSFAQMPRNIMKGAQMPRVIMNYLLGDGDVTELLREKSVLKIK